MKLSAIHVHPIKALRSVTVAAARVEAAGLEHDRRWMLVDETGRFVSLREEARLSRFEIELLGHRDHGGDQGGDQGRDQGRDQGYRVAMGGEALVVPRAHEGPRVPVEVWGSHTRGVVHDEGSEFFSAHLGRALRLVYLPDDEVRPADGAARPGARVSFADAYPYLVIGEASLQGLRERLGDPALPMTRFRPNLVIEGAAPHAEDGWARVRIGAVELRGVARCDRCVVTTIDPLTGEAGREPLRTLAGYRREDGKVWFGAYFVPEGEGVVRVGDAVVVETGG